MQRIKDLFYVFTNKLLFIELLLEVLKSFTIYLLKLQAKYDINNFATENKSIDMRNVPESIKRYMIHDADVLKARWDLCSTCEFLKNDKCTSCGCYMKVKHKLAPASCPEGKWGKYEQKDLNAITNTI